MEVLLCLDYWIGFWCETILTRTIVENLSVSIRHACICYPVFVFVYLSNFTVTHNSLLLLFVFLRGECDCSVLVFKKFSLVQILELPSHPFYVGVQFHPEFKSRPGRPSALFLGTFPSWIRLSYLMNHMKYEPRVIYTICVELILTYVIWRWYVWTFTAH